MKRADCARLFISALFALAGVLLSDGPLQMALCGAAGLLLISLLWFMQQRMRPFEVNRALDKLLKRERERIGQDVYRDWESAFANWDTDKQLTYELLRELGTLLHNDTIRLQQVALLHFFALRKDMDLVLEPLLISQYDPLLADYIGEISKIKRDLIKDKTFQYVINHEVEILGLDNGQDILTGAAGAAVRMKRYVQSYPGLVRRYAHRLPKDRFLRLYRMIQQYPNDNWDRLATEVNRIYHEKYEWDSDFQITAVRSSTI
ncbi:hypothetical protein M3650_23230 [Paenibacillus sp. MER TA 81-3]|uniref:hypothetical protein n=1 Tax=Paenibacillus sp. MER TA 81-3 TaxID=2939573 RepID=UPI00203DE436|nr:hypothetical protein [Paenibacillus sp. MER TA 81-3]MCM3341473.1 hypothetical protein [Paenibacillus sp. MER TA 81-3]